ncbi:MAG TPA: DivIVA domain-containing protein [Clostridiaceae bacterium]|jgi:cell division initiation protein|nr:DivIVA domain-containing protein [Clostridiaceae bacterium]
MNFTPDDLQNMVFRKSIMGGFDEDQVNETLDKVIEDYNSFISQIAELKDRINLLNEGIQYYKKMEQSLENTIMIARQTCEEMKTNAFEKAQNIVKEAENQAQEILLNARSELARVKMEYEDVKKKIAAFKSKAELALTAQLELLKKMDEGIV